MEQLLALTEKQMRGLRNVGEINVRHTVAALRGYGLTLHPEPARFCIHDRFGYCVQDGHLPLLPSPDANDHVFVAQAPPDALERDLQVAQRRAQGMSFKQISTELGVSESIVRERMHRHNTRTHHFGDRPGDPNATAHNEPRPNAPHDSLPPSEEPEPSEQPSSP